MAVCASCNIDRSIGCIHFAAVPEEKEQNAAPARPAEPPVQIYVPAQRREVRSGGSGKAQVREVYGPAGPAGAEGRPGVEGRPGCDGRDGSIAEAIQAAESHMRTWLAATLKTAVSNAIKELGDLRGAAGLDGKDSTIPGPSGKDGAPGKDGKSIVGERGAPGKDADISAVTDAASRRMEQYFAALQTSIKSEISAAVGSEVDRQLQTGRRH